MEWDRRTSLSTNISQNATCGSISESSHDDRTFKEYNVDEHSLEDLVIHCSICDAYVKVDALRGHRAYHAALVTIEWNKKGHPQNLASLVAQRNSVLTRLKNELLQITIQERTDPASYKRSAKSNNGRSSSEILSHIERLNKAYEYLKHDIDPVDIPIASSLSGDQQNMNKGYNSVERNDRIRNVSFASRLSCVYGVGVSSIQNKNYRRDMENVSVFKDCLFAEDNNHNSTNASYFALFDGYNGSTAAFTASQHLHDFLKDAIESCSTDSKTRSKPTIYNSEESCCSVNLCVDEEKSREITSNDKESIVVHKLFSARSASDTKEILETKDSLNVVESMVKQMKPSVQPEEGMSFLEKNRFRQQKPVCKNDRAHNNLIADKDFQDFIHVNLDRNKFFMKASNIKTSDDDDDDGFRNNRTRPDRSETLETLSRYLSDNERLDGSMPAKYSAKQTSSMDANKLAFMTAAFKKAYQKTDVILSYGVGETSRVRWSGCSAATLLIESSDQDKTENRHQKSSEQKEIPNNDPLTESNLTVSCSREKLPSCSVMSNPDEIVGRLSIANIGNVEAFIVKGNQAYSLTKRHVPENKKEKERILRRGGFLTQSRSKSLVNGVLKTTRGLGNHGDEEIRRCVLASPSVFCTDIERQSQLIVIASAGVWDVLSGQEAASLLVQLLPMNRLPNPSRVNTSLLQLLNEQAMEQSSKFDDLTEPEVIECASQENPQIKKCKGILNPSVPNKNGGLTKSEFLEQSKLSSRIGIVEEESNNDVSHPQTANESYNDKRVICEQSQSELHQHFARNMSRYLVRAAMLAGSRQNITAMVILLPGCGL